MNILSENKDIIIPIMTLLLGSLLTFGIQFQLFKNQMKWDKTKLESQFLMEEQKSEKFFQHEIQKIELQFSQEQLNNKMSYYNRVLQAIKSTPVSEQDQFGEFTFHYDNYLRIIKPILYENLHLLPSETVKNIDDIDHVIARQTHYEEEDEDDAETCYYYYENIIKPINEEVVKFRRQYLDTINT